MYFVEISLRTKTSDKIYIHNFQMIGYSYPLFGNAKLTYSQRVKKGIGSLENG